MKIGIVLPTFTRSPRRVVETARLAEELGLDGAFCFDHLYPLGGPPDGPSLEAFSMLSAVAASTERIALGTLVARASLRPAGLLAKLAASVDGIAGPGRTILAIGTGDAKSRGEHEAYGFGFLGPEDRRAQLAETVDAVTALFEGRGYSGGRWVPETRGPLLPPPATPGGPPIWVGGTSEAVVRLAAEHARGWNGWGLADEDFARCVGVLRAAAGERAVQATWADAVAVGRDRAEAHALRRDREARGRPPLWTASGAEVAERLRRVRDAGAAWAILLPAGGEGRLEVLAETVLPALAAG